MGASFPGPCALPGRRAGGDFVRQLCRWALLGSGQGPSWGPSQRLPRALSPHPSRGLGTRARAWMTRTAQVAGVPSGHAASPDRGPGQKAGRVILGHPQALLVLSVGTGPGWTLW